MRSFESLTLKLAVNKELPDEKTIFININSAYTEKEKPII